MVYSNTTYLIGGGIGVTLYQSKCISISEWNNNMENFTSACTQLSLRVWGWWEKCYWNGRSLKAVGISHSIRQDNVMPHIKGLFLICTLNTDRQRFSQSALPSKHRISTSATHLLNMAFGHCRLSPENAEEHSAFFGENRYVPNDFCSCRNWSRSSLFVHTDWSQVSRNGVDDPREKLAMACNWCDRFLDDVCSS